MEARSLSSLNSLAANPPQYPEKPFDENEEPLVLYISRVPGTRDVILSPFKPQVKNVTGQDVANSLYYAHLEMSHPVLSPSTIQDPDQGRPSEDNPLSQTIPRKPLPGNLGTLRPDGLSGGGSQILPLTGGQENQAPIPSTQGEAVPSLSHYQHASVYSEPFLDNQLVTMTDLPDQPPTPPPHKFFALPPRKPAGPMAIVDAPKPKRESLIPETRIDGIPTKDVLAGESAQAFDYARPRHHRSHSRSPSPTKRSRSASIQGNPFTLTLIRRDPSSGSQWNVGRISSHQVEPLPADEDNAAGLLSASPPPVSQWSSSAVRPPIDVHLETSGYAKYRRMPPKISMDGHAGAPSAAALKAMALAGAPAEDHTANRGEIGVFSRQVVMEYSKSWTSNLRDKLQRLEKSSRTGKSHMRNGSDDSTDSVGSNASAGEHAPSSIGYPGRGMKPRGYTFNSPWDGKCEFRTGHGGRSLRCQHILHDGQSAPYNPLLADQGSNVPRSAAATISELRFNLPGSELFSDQPRDTKAQIRGHFNKLLRASRGEYDEGDEDDEDDTISPFDVNVGSENAGGGNSGKRAKLGKLIIYSEGLKMLDLVVAANIGVWWGVWERSF